MTDTPRQVTGEAQGRLLADLLNQEVKKNDRRARSLQEELQRFFTGVSRLSEELANPQPRKDWLSDVRNLERELNRFLETCQEHPQLFIAVPGKLPLFPVIEWVPTRTDPIRHNPVRHRAVSAICGLAKYGLLDRIRQCRRTADYEGRECGRWFFAKKSDSLYCSRDCQVRPSEERKLRKREYARLYYLEQKERARQAGRKPKGAK